MSHSHVSSVRLPKVGAYVNFIVGDGPHKGASCYGRVVKHESTGSFQEAKAVLDNGAVFQFSRGDRCTFISDQPAGAIELERARVAHAEALGEVAERHRRERRELDDRHTSELEKCRARHEADRKRFGAQERAYRESLERHLFWTRAALIGILLALGIGFVIAAGPERWQAWATSYVTSR